MQTTIHNTTIVTADDACAVHDNAAIVVKEFLHQVEQERLWEESTVRQFALNLRTAIGILAEGLPEVRSAFAEWGSGQSTV